MKTLDLAPIKGWVISDRVSGVAQVVRLATPELGLALLGVPASYPRPEVETWLWEVIKAAVSTHSADSLTSSVPPVLHHAMSGLLFSLGETWNEFESGLPCAAAFLNNDEGCVFGWAGVGRVSVTVGGLQVVPRWIRIVDRAGREGRVATFWPQVDVRVVIDWWPEGNNRSAPVASLEAEWTPTDIPGASQEKFRLALASEIKRRGLDKRQRLDRPAADAAETPVTPLTELWAPLVKPEDPGRVMAAYLLGGLADPSARPAAFPGEVRDLIRKLHEPIVEAIERKLLELEGKRFESLASQQQFVKDLGELLGQLDLRIKCQECGAPSTLVVIPRNSTRGTFQFRHQGRGRTNHGRGGDRKSEDGSALPRLELIADNPI